MSAVAWLLVLAVSVVVAFVVGRMTAPSTSRTKTLEHERDAAASELRRYREDVSAHFEKTATLFNQLTGNYRGLYEHLAEGSQRLGLGEDANLLHAEPERRKLTGQQEQTAADAEGAGAADDARDREPAPKEDPETVPESQKREEEAAKREKPREPAGEESVQEVADEAREDTADRPPADFATEEDDAPRTGKRNSS